MNVKRLVKEIARLEKSDDVLALKALKKELDTLKKAPANAIRNSIWFWCVKRPPLDFRSIGEIEAQVQAQLISHLLQVDPCDWLLKA